MEIITGWKSDGTPISEMRYISPKELDPLVPYTNSTGVYLDTDEDGIPDVVESWFSNVSIVKSASYRQEFKQKRYAGKTGKISDLVPHLLFFFPPYRGIALLPCIHRE